MSLLPRKGLLAVAAVVDIALHSRERPVSAKALASRQGLPPRHLEPVLQALVRDGILRGIRGPRGGYELGRDKKRISTDDILRAAGTADVSDDESFESALVSRSILPAISQAERAFSHALSRITVEDLMKRA